MESVNTLSNLIGVNSVKEPLTGIIPVSLLFERSLHFTGKIGMLPHHYYPRLPHKTQHQQEFSKE